jgi:Ca2+-transporting ATPase
MWQFICGVGLAMTAVLLLIYILFEQEDGMSEYELSLFFTIFVMLQFWNLFNAKAFLTGRSAFAQLGQSKGFLFIVSLIFVGQILIVQLGGEMFNVVPLSLRDWLLIIINTSSVFLFGELWRGLPNSRTPELL